MMGQSAAAVGEGQPWRLTALPIQGYRDRLEALSGDRAGQHSIRVNDQWRGTGLVAPTPPTLTACLVLAPGRRAEAPSAR
jgi:hypothetical protein